MTGRLAAREPARMPAKHGGRTGVRGRTLAGAGGPGGPGGIAGGDAGREGR